MNFGKIIVILEVNVIADLILCIHFCVVIFVVFGLLIMPIGCLFNLNWTRNRRMRSIHLALMGFVTLETLMGITCPLTYLENAMRGIDYNPSFISYWLLSLVYWDLPTYYFMTVYILCLLWTVLFWKLHPPNKLKKPCKTLKR